MTAFKATHVESYGIEPMCRVLQIARAAVEGDHPRPKNFGVYGAKKVWLQLNGEGFKVGRDRVARLADCLHRGRAHS